MKAECYTCYGSGGGSEARLACPTCGGRGWVERNDPDDEDFDEDDDDDWEEPDSRERDHDDFEPLPF